MIVPTVSYMFVGAFNMSPLLNFIIINLIYTYTIKSQIKSNTSLYFGLLEININLINVNLNAF